MPEKGELVPKTSEGVYQSDFVQQFFSNTARINKKAVEKALQDALKENPTTEERIEKKDKNMKIFENLKEDREESKSEEEENRSDEAKTVPEGEEKGADDQNCENEEDNLEVEVVEQETASEKNKWEKELQKRRRR
ncbi:VID27-like protein [Rosa chinensis]|uniref:VID27-like protein n=1 Tax=Rosa chinensis TaxID=74649 RepID=UPI000D090A6B|nr:VID27-like protein [Rosa chinensis]